MRCQLPRSGSTSFTYSNDVSVFTCNSVSKDGNREEVQTSHRQHVDDLAGVSSRVILFTVSRRLMLSYSSSKFHS